MEDKHLQEVQLLIDAYKAGDNIAFAKLIAPYTSLLLRVALSILKIQEDAEDCYTEVITTFLLKEIASRQQTFTNGAEAAKSYLIKSVRNKALTIYKNKKKQRKIWQSIAEYFKSSPISYDPVKEREEFDNIIKTYKEFEVATEPLHPEQKTFLDSCLRHIGDSFYKQKVMQELNITDSKFRTLQKSVYRDLKRNILEIQKNQSQK